MNDQGINKSVFSPHEYPCTGFPPEKMVLKTKPLSYWKNIMRPMAELKHRRQVFIWRFRDFCEFENIPHIRIGGEDGTEIFQYLRLLIIPRTKGLNGDGI